MIGLRPQPRGDQHEGLLVLAPLSLEARAVRSGVGRGRVMRTGMGPERAVEAVKSAVAREADAVAVAGFCGSLDAGLEPGDVIVATEVRGPDGAVECPSAGVLAGVLERHGVRAVCGPIVSTDHVVHGDERRELAASGALAVDMESAQLAAGARDRPVAVLRVVVDTPDRELRDPLATVTGGLRAYRALARASKALAEWAAAVGPRRLMLASPRASCAGVERAIEAVERALEQHGPPVYVRKQIVHNAHVVADLEERGAVFVEELEQVPEGATVVFSAHGVSPAVRSDAGQRRLDVIDATCPLVAKVHGEARRFADAGYTIVLIGHDGHEEVEGTVGEAPDSTVLVESIEEVDSLEVGDPERVAFLTQTTLAVDETKGIVDALRERFPALVGPRSDDICYATQNRQDAVRALARDCDLVLVIGSRNSSNSQRLVEVAERAGCRARLIDDERDIDPAWLAAAGTVGLTAGASAPERLVQQVVSALTGLGPVQLEERTVRNEGIRFKLPPEIRKRG
jgi:4-hydroxy-3-methylbut-2-en-1-yl diphosphate reductase